MREPLMDSLMRPIENPKIPGWRRGRFVVSLASMVSLCILVQSCSVLEKTPGIGKHMWLFASGEVATARHPAEIRVFEEVRMALIEKELRREPLTGREFYIYRGTPSDHLPFICGEPLEKRPSARNGFDQEWEYDWCIVYFWRGRIKDLQFKDTPNEPQPVLRRSTDLIPK
jgi:hypothetical protein